MALLCGRGLFTRSRSFARCPTSKGASLRHAEPDVPRSCQFIPVWLGVIVTLHSTPIKPDAFAKACRASAAVPPSVASGNASFIVCDETTHFFNIPNQQTGAAAGAGAGAGAETPRAPSLKRRASGTPPLTRLRARSRRRGSSKQGAKFVAAAAPASDAPTFPEFCGDMAAFKFAVKYLDAVGKTYEAVGPVQGSASPRTLLADGHAKETMGRWLAGASHTVVGAFRLAILEKISQDGEFHPRYVQDLAAYARAKKYNWTAAQWKQLETTVSSARHLTKERIDLWDAHTGELSVECQQVTPLVRDPLVDVFGKIQG